MHPETQAQPLRVLYLTTDQLAERLGLAPITVETWRKRGKGPPYVRLGRAVRYRISDVEAWAESQLVTPSEGR